MRVNADDSARASRAPHRPRILMAPLQAGFAVLVGCLLLVGCGRQDGAPAPEAPLAGADAERGRRIMSHYQCGSCHVIPQVPAAAGRIGPSLERYARRSYIAGCLPNAPHTLARWIEAPASLLPETTMPDMGASAADARDMAAYLMTLR
jgi:cytochrome c2